MNRLIIGLLALSGLVACSNENKTNTGSNTDEDVFIRLSAGMPSATANPDSKAVISGNATFTASVAGWEALAGEEDYSASPTWEASIADIQAEANQQSVALNPSQVYNADDDIKTYMKAWYPTGNVEAGKVAFANTDGTVDALLAGAVSGSKWDNEGKVLQFTHPATQIKFIVKEGSGLAANTTIERITIIDAELPTGFDLTSDVVTYAAKANLDIPGIDGSLVIGTTETGDRAGEPVMIRPMSGNTLALEVETSTATFDVTATIDGDADFVAGKAYTITLTFMQSDIELSATVTPWTEGTGSGQVE